MSPMVRSALPFALAAMTLASPACAQAQQAQQAPVAPWIADLGDGVNRHPSVTPGCLPL